MWSQEFPLTLRYTITPPDFTGIRTIRTSNHDSAGVFGLGGNSNVHAVKRADMARRVPQVASGRRFRSGNSARPRRRSVSRNEASFNARHPLAECADITAQLAYVLANSCLPRAHVLADTCFPSIHVPDEARLHRLHFLAKACLHRADVLADLSLKTEHQPGETHADREHRSEQREQLGRPTVAPCADFARPGSCHLPIEIRILSRVDQASIGYSRITGGSNGSRERAAQAGFPPGDGRQPAGRAPRDPEFPRARRLVLEGRRRQRSGGVP